MTTATPSTSPVASQDAPARSAKPVAARPDAKPDEPAVPVPQPTAEPKPVVEAKPVVDKPAAPTQVNAMLLRDQLTHKKVTQVRYLSRKPHTVPAAWLNPMFLARNPVLE